MWGYLTYVNQMFRKINKTPDRVYALVSWLKLYIYIDKYGDLKEHNTPVGGSDVVQTSFIL